ncbi:MAG TPA: transglycosylase SLT domain-containing protein [Solirubrobacteraceae bacterium]
MRRLLVIAVALTIGLPMVAVLLLFSAAGSQAQCGGGPAGPGSAPPIPASLLGIYDQAAGAYQLGPQGWAYLAAINYVETRFGQDLSPSSQGAIGWMQFEPGTWARYAVSADPAKPGAAPDPYDPWDAIYAAANDLHANGAPGDWPPAIYAYHHAGWYASEVQPLAQRYTQQAGSAAVAIDASHAAPQAGCVPAAPTTPGSTARILPVAAAPQNAPARCRRRSRPATRSSTPATAPSASRTCSAR